MDWWITGGKVPFCSGKVIPSCFIEKVRYNNAIQILSDPERGGFFK